MLIKITCNKIPRPGVFVRAETLHDAQIIFANGFLEKEAAALILSDPSFTIEEIKNLEDFVKDMPMEFMIDADVSF